MFYKKSISDNVINLIVLSVSILLLSIFIVFPLFFLILNMDSSIKNNKIRIYPIEHELKKQFKYYQVSFNKTLNLPNYTLYYLNATSKRCSNNHFYRDIDLNTRNHTAFKNIGYDRGHLTPSSDVFDSCTTFNMGNVAPQIPCYNQIIWNKLEQYIRLKYINHTILTVPEYNLFRFISDFYGNNLHIPIGFYKLIFNKNMDLVYNIYLQHSLTNPICRENFYEVGDFKKTYFLLLISFTKKLIFFILLCLCIILQ